MHYDTQKTKSPDYLFRNPHSYCFRLGVPETLRDIVGRRELRYSLRTGRLSEARRRSRLLAGLFQQLFSQIKFHRAAYGRTDVETKIQEFLVFVLQDPGNLPRSNLSPEAFTASAGIKLKRLVDDYVSENLRSERWSQRTIKEYRTCLNLFLLYFGDVALSTITYIRMREYKDLLMRLPSNYSKKPQYRDQSLEQVCGSKAGKGLSVSAINRYLRLASSLFRYAIKNGHMSVDYAQGLKLPKKRRPDEERSIFTKEDLEKLFYSTEYEYGTHRHPWQFWLPVLAVFTGARLEELCQLSVSDVYEEDKIWVLDINSQDGKRLKNRSSERLVPLHPTIIGQLGFPQYVERVRAGGNGRVFPELRRVQGCYGHYPSRWFRKYRKSCGVSASNKNFHSFRHTFVDGLKQKQVPEVLVSQFVGHNIPGITYGRYGKPIDVKDLYQSVVLKLEFGLEWRVLNRN